MEEGEGMREGGVGKGSVRKMGCLNMLEEEEEEEEKVL